MMQSALPEVEDIAWQGDYASALEDAKRLQRPLVLMAAGQGYDPLTDQW